MDSKERSNTSAIRDTHLRWNLGGICKTAPFNQEVVENAVGVREHEMLLHAQLSRHFQLSTVEG